MAGWSSSLRSSRNQTSAAMRSSRSSPYTRAGLGGAELRKMGDAEVVGVDVGHFRRHVGRRQAAILEFAAVERAQAAHFGGARAEVEKVKNLLTQAAERKSRSIPCVAGFQA